MNLIVGSPWWLIAFLFLALVAAAIEDGLRLRISNVSCSAVVIGVLVAAGFHGFSSALWQNVVVGVAILAAGTAAFAAKWLGGGDVKLLAAIGLWLDLKAATGLIAAVFLAGGLLAIVYIAARRIAHRPRQAHPVRGRVPYGVAIAIGAMFIFTTQLRERPANPFLDQRPAARAAEGSYSIQLCAHGQ